MTFNLYKTIIACVALTCITVLMALSKMDSGVGAPIITAILFYSVGNGIAAASRKAVEPLMERKPKAKQDVVE